MHGAHTTVSHGSAARRRPYQLAAEGVLGREQIRDRMNAMQLERLKIERRLGQVKVKNDDVLRFLRAALDLLEQVHQPHLDSDEQRRLLNQAIFERLHIEDEQAVDARYRQPFAALSDAGHDHTAINDEGAVRRGDASNEVRSIRSLLQGEVSSKDHVVGPVGLEPTTQGLKVPCSAN